MAETTTAALQRIPLFAGLSDQELERLARDVLHRIYARGDVIFNRGDVGDRAYLIVEGAVDLVIESADGRELILGRLSRGEYFGELALVDDARRSATVRAAERTELLVVLRHAFLEALERQPEMSRHVIRTLSRRLRASDERFEALAYLDASGRLARTLLRLPVDGDETVHASHEELAHMSSLSRQTTTTVLGGWQDEGYVELARRGVRLTDRAALRTVAEL